METWCANPKSEKAKWNERWIYWPWLVEEIAHRRTLYHLIGSTSGIEPRLTPRLKCRDHYFRGRSLHQNKCKWKQVSRLWQVLKLLNENIDSNNFFLKINLVIELDDSALVKDQSCLDVRKYSFFQRTVNDWNKLSPGCTNSIALLCSRTE